MKARVVIGKKSAWWNRQLKGWWTWGSLIGFAISLLIASQIARWLAITLAVLGCLFAMVFRRFARREAEI
jgi:hypothetical protein